MIVYIAWYVEIAYAYAWKAQFAFVLIQAGEHKFQLTISFKKVNKKVF